VNTEGEKYCNWKFRDEIYMDIIKSNREEENKEILHSLFVTFKNFINSVTSDRKTTNCSNSTDY